MSIVYSLDPSKNTAYAVWAGVITAQDWRESVTAFLAEPELHRIRRVIVDAERVTDNSSLTDTDIKDITTLFLGGNQSVSKARFAVVSTDMFGKTGTSAKALIQKGFSVVVFNALDTACIYLDLPLEETKQILNELHAGRQRLPERTE